MLIAPLPEVAVARQPTRSERAAVRVLQIGCVAAVLIAATYRDFDLDRFFVPKELVLHLTAAAMGFLLLGSLRSLAVTRVDLLLLAFLCVSGVSAALATNPWAALRALGISVSGVLVFWCARALREAGMARRVVFATALAAVVTAIACLLQAYGVRSDFFSLNRSPGGTLGNRNFVAHLVAFSLPALLLTTLRAWRKLGFVIGASGTAIALWALILTRSRAAWLGVAIALVVLLVGALLSRPVRRDRRYLLRTILLLVFAAGGVTGAVSLPNALKWRSESPYLETARGVVNYREGSGRGRLLQYRNSLSMLADYPLLGAGPGNWQVHYAEHAEASDPSLDRSEAGMTANPWPSSDWVAYLSERGLLGFGILVLAGVGLAVAAWRRLRTARDSEEGLAAVACVAVVAATVTTGMFDAVLLLGWPTLLVWATLGALWSPETARPAPAPTMLKTVVVVLLALGASAAAVHSLGSLSAMSIYASDPGPGRLEMAAKLDPGNYRVRIAAARNHRRGSEGRCRHAGDVLRYYPNSASARSLARSCD